MAGSSPARYSHQALLSYHHEDNNHTGMGCRDPPRSWLKKFARRTYKNRTLLSSMQTIAAASPTQKRAIVSHFRISQLFAEAFDPAIVTPTTLSSIDSLGRDPIASSLRHLLEAFYEIALQEGVPIDALGNPGWSFSRRQFVEFFQQENFDRVCPFCDGDMNGPQVDHWLPKSKYPALSCHPKNLIPVCHHCNSRECKGEQSPLTLTNHRPFDDWFHPYERPAHGNFSVRVNEPHVSLTNDDPVQQTRLNNFDQLVKLTRRWWEEYRRQKQNYLSQLAGRVRKRMLKPTNEEVLKTVKDWLEDLAEERHMPHSVIRRVVLERAKNEEAPDFHTWLEHAEDAIAPQLPNKR